MNKETTKKQPIKEILEAFVKNKNGVIFQVLQHKTKKGYVMLRLKNKYIEKRFVEVRQGIIDGFWSEINEHEYRAWYKEDHEYMMDLSNRLVKRVLISQILLELDDSLEPDFEDNKYFKNVLEKSKKQCERLANDQFDRLYGIDKTYVTNFTNTIDEVATLCSKINLVDYVYLPKLLKDFIANPEKHHQDKIEFTELDT